MWSWTPTSDLAKLVELAGFLCDRLKTSLIHGWTAALGMRLAHFFLRVQGIGLGGEGMGVKPWMAWALDTELANATLLQGARRELLQTAPHGAEGCSLEEEPGLVCGHMHRFHRFKDQRAALLHHPKAATSLGFTQMALNHSARPARQPILSAAGLR